jgi:SAM-dependent methyltransferase
MLFWLSTNGKNSLLRVRSGAKLRRRGMSARLPLCPQSQTYRFVALSEAMGQQATYAKIYPRKKGTFIANIYDMNEHPADRIGAIYEQFAREWDADRNDGGWWSDKHWHDRFIEYLGSDAAVLDLGCGSGRPVAQNLVSHGVRVTGVDVSPTMISLCRSRMPEQEWIVSDMRSLALDRQFDGILAWDSYFFLRHDDQRRMFDVFAAHAADGCVLMFNAGPAHGEAVGEYRGEPLYHASLAPMEFEALLARSDFEILEHRAEDPQTGGRVAWIAKSRKPK